MRWQKVLQLCVCAANEQYSEKVDFLFQCPAGCWIQSSSIYYQFQQFFLQKCGGYGDETSVDFAQDFPWIKTQEKIPPRRKGKVGSVPAKWILAWNVIPEFYY